MASYLQNASAYAPLESIMAADSEPTTPNITDLGHSDPFSSKVMGVRCRGSAKISILKYIEAPKIWGLTVWILHARNRASTHIVPLVTTRGMSHVQHVNLLSTKGLRLYVLMLLCGPWEFPFSKEQCQICFHRRESLSQHSLPLVAQYFHQHHNIIIKL